MLLYANTDDLLQGWLEDEPDNATALLRIASGMVRSATLGAIYAVSDGYATDTAQRQAFTDATCAQVAMWVAADIDPGSAGVGSSEPSLASVSTTAPGGSVSRTYSDTAGPVQQARAEATKGLCAEALTILRNAGLLNGQPW